MNLEELIKIEIDEMELEELIKIEIDEMELEEENKRLEYFESLYIKYNGKDYTSIGNLSEGELFALLLLANYPKKSVENVKKAIEIIDDYFETVIKDDLDKFINDIYPTYKTMVAVEDGPGITKLMLKLSKHKNIMAYLSDYIIHNENLVNSWIKLLMFKSRQINAEKVLRHRLNQDQLPNKLLKKVESAYHEKCAKLIKEDTNYPAIFYELENYHLKLRKDLKKKRKTLNLYKDLLKRLEQEERFTSIENSWNMFSCEIQLKLIEKVFENQEDRHIMLQQEEENLNKHSLNYSILLEHGIHPYLIEQIESSQFEEEKLREVLNVFDQNNFPISDITDKDCLTTLLKGDKQSVEDIIAYFKTDAISISFLEAHQEILEPASENNPNGAKEIVAHNFKLLKEENASFNSKSFDSNILLMNTDELKKRIYLAKEYGLKLSNNSDVFNLIKEERLFDLVDFALEHQLPLEEVIKINSDRDDIIPLMKRFIIAENFGFELLTSDDEISYNIQNGNSFFITREKLDDIIENSTPYEQDEKMAEILNKRTRLDIGLIDSFVQKIDENYLDEDGERYNFNGVFISRNKVLRNRTTLKEHFDSSSEEDILYQSIIYQTILRTDELNSIKKCIYKPKEKILSK